MSVSRIVIGVGGTGKTFALQTWSAQLEADGIDVRWLRAGPGQPITAAQVADAVGADGAVVADDVHWFEPEAVRALLAAADATMILAARRPLAGDRADDLVDLLDALDDALGRQTPPERRGLVDLESFAALLAGLRAASGSERAAGAMATDEVVALHQLSGGSAGLAADLLAAGWDYQGPPSAELVDAVQRRIRRAGPDAAALAQLWTLAALVPRTDGDSLELALRALPPEIDGAAAERALRIGGFVSDEGTLITLVARTTLADLPQARRAELHDRLGEALVATDAVTAARHLRRGTGTGEDVVAVLGRAALDLSATEPEESQALIDRAEEWGLPAADVAFLRGLGAFRTGSGQALQHLDQVLQHLGDGETQATHTTIGDAALLGFGLDVRELRFEVAAQRPLDGDLAASLRRLATMMSGGPGPDTEAEAGSGTAISGLMATTAAALDAVTAGDTAAAIGGFTAAADDFDRLAPTSPLGFTPHQLGALGAIALGDLPAAATLTTQAQVNLSGGPGEALTHLLLEAYGALVGGDYQPALALLRIHAPEGALGIDASDIGSDPDASASTGTDDTDPDGQSETADRYLAQRDRLLLSAIEAAIARRSGDTGRLRSAWSRAEQALLRQSTSWLLSDFLIEVLACGSRLDAYERTAPVVEAVLEQTASLPADGPAPVMGHWLRLQVAIAADDGDGVDEAAAALGTLSPKDRRSKARVAAGAVWADIFARSAGEERTTTVAEELLACGEAWEASRLLGQAALDETDPQAARRLLERARTTGIDVVEEGGSGGLAALGLSDREAEVAVLVVEGRTHKEIGAQLYISPKTVEHHVAKIRQKVGATSRAELLSIVRDAIG